MQQYLDWIDKQIPHDSEAVWNECAKYTDAMLAAFPELKKVRGHVLLSTGYERPHWWLETPEGAIVDPTAHQFHGSYYGAATRIVEYLPHDESQPEPTGKCPNCGGYCYNGNEVCSDRCGDAYTAYLMDSIR